MNTNRAIVGIALLAGIAVGAVIPVLQAQSVPPAAPQPPRYHQFCESYNGPRALEQLTSEANRRGRAGYLITGHAIDAQGGCGERLLHA